MPVSVKNFWLYPDKISFLSGGQVMMRFASYGIVSCNYLTTGTQAESSPTALDQAALLALWDTLDGKWVCSDSSVEFLLVGGKPMLTMDGTTGEAIDGARLSETVWSITVKNPDGRQIYYVDTGVPKDNLISIRSTGAVYRQYSYSGDL